MTEQEPRIGNQPEPTITASQDQPDTPEIQNPQPNATNEQSEQPDEQAKGSDPDLATLMAQQIAAMRGWGQMGVQVTQKGQMVILSKADSVQMIITSNFVMVNGLGSVFNFFRAVE